MIVINKSVFCGNLDGARLLGHPVQYSGKHCNAIKDYNVRHFVKRIKTKEKSMLGNT